MASQLQTDSLSLIVAGLSFVVGGVIMFRKGKTDEKD
ncbi:MAG: LPXTG cell wall anchor domain-containing protein [Eubacteriales bacterium]